MHLVGGEIRVTHSLPGVTGVSLESVYLGPIVALPTIDHPAQLVIDLKTSPSDALFTAVVAAIAAHSEFDDGHVRFVMTGTRPAAPSAHPAHVVFGGPRTLANLTDSEVAIIEVDYDDYFTWDGAGPVPRDVEFGLRTLANDAHAAGKQIRIYFAPATAASWQAQYEAGIDWIQPGGQHPPGADDIAGLAAWFASL